MTLISTKAKTFARTNTEERTERVAECYIELARALHDLAKDACGSDDVNAVYRIMQASFAASSRARKITTRGFI